MRVVLSPGLKLDVLDGDAVEGELEVVDGADDGGVETVGEARVGARDLTVPRWLAGQAG